MVHGSSKVQAFRIAISAFLILGGLFVFGVLAYGVDRLPLRELFLASTAFAIALLAVVVYQSVRINATAAHLANDMAKDILLYSRELFSELYRSSPVPYILIDEQGVIESTNYAAVRLFNIGEGMLDEQNIFSYIEGDNEQQISLIPEKLKQGLFVSDVECRIRRNDDTRRDVQLSLFSFKDSAGKRKGLLTLVDITKQKQIDKAKTEFVSLASHQLRTPISALKWNIELFHMASPETLTPLQQEYLLTIAHGVGRMNQLIDDFLNVSKFELGTLTTEMTDVELNACIAEVEKEHEGRATAGKVRIEIAVSESPFMLCSDTHLLTMIIGNLLSNAIKYTREGGVVRVRAERAEGHIVIAVSDTGIGIPQDEQEQIFSKIFRASNARKQSVEGTGLGLYIVREAARVLGGDVTFTSTEEVGTTFTVVLPE